MNYEWLDEYCQSKKFAEKDYKVEWDAIRYIIKGKMFALQGEDNKGRLFINLKLEPGYGMALRQKYEDIEPGYHMNKVHWNLVNLEGNVPDEILKDMIDQSHYLIFNALPKKVQKELVDNEE